MLGLTPAALLLAWMVALAGLVAAPWPHILGVALAILLLAVLLAANVLLRLLRRTRWLLLTVFVLFAWMTPGMPVPALPGASLDGLLQGAEQLSRLLVSLAMVAILLGRMSIDHLLVACHGLLRPLHHLGLNIDRFILRLALTLRQIDRPDEGFPATISLQAPPWRFRDLAFLAGVVVFSVVFR
jgi:energy-coupling factor transport system permease protein